MNQQQAFGLEVLTAPPPSLPSELPPSRAQVGDLWALGPHRLLVDDSTSYSKVLKLMDGRKAQMCFTDPPYNVDYGKHSGAAKDQDAAHILIQNDSMSPEEWDMFCRCWITNLLTFVDGALYVCMSSKELGTVDRILREKGGHWSDTLIWAKDRFTLGRADYQRQYEPIWYGWREGCEHYWRGARDLGDVLHSKLTNKRHIGDFHPTMKPVELVKDALHNSSKEGDLVLDLFLGSGTTLVAAEEMGRVCYGCEIEPKYADAILARWERQVGDQKAKLIARPVKLTH